MDTSLKDCALRPMAKRVRNHVKRSENKKHNGKRSQNTKPSTHQEEASAKARHESHCNIGVNLLEGQHLKSLTKPVDVVQETYAKKDEIMTTVQKWASEQQSSTEKNSWMSTLNSSDIYWLVTASNPVENLKDHILSLPHFLSNIFEKSSLEVLPTLYKRDHVWLTMQWYIDDVDNPFLSRPCESVPCLGSYIPSLTDTVARKHIPELVPLTTLEQYRYFIATGGSTKEWKQLLTERRQDPSLALTLYPLGKDVWSQPKCLLCRLQDIFSLAIDPTSIRKSMRLSQYQQCYSIQLEGLLPYLYLDKDELNVSWILEETNVLLPHLRIPLIGMLVRLLEYKPPGNVNVDKWYAEI